MKCKEKLLACETCPTKWIDFQQQQATADELSGDCDPAVKPGGLLCCSNLKSASEETYLLLGNVTLALLILEVKILNSNGVYILLPVAGSFQSLIGGYCGLGLCLHAVLCKTVPLNVQLSFSKSL